MNIKQIATLSAIFILIACTARTGSIRVEPILSRAALEARVFSLYEAEQKEDWRSWYLLTALAQTGEVTYKEFMDELESSKKVAENFNDPRFRRRGKFLLIRINKIDPKIVAGDFEFAEAAASVQMYLVVEYPAGPIERIKDQTDYWVYFDGNWYWTWRGWPDD